MLRMLHLARRGRDEARRAVAWSWLAPPAGIALALVFVGRATAPLVVRADLGAHALELGLPLLGVFVAAPLVAREWELRSLALVAVRAPLWSVLAPRLACALGWLALVAVGGAAFCAGGLPAGADRFGWAWRAVGTALAPTVLLIALALLATQAMVSAPGGTMLAAALWLGNLMLGLFAGSGTLPAFWERAQGFALFAATFPPPIPNPPPLAVNRWLLVGGALLALALMPPLLRREGRLLRSSEMD